PLLAALAAAPAARAAFKDATAETGIDFAHGTTQPEYDRAGAAALDADGDGWPDLLGARVDLPPVLYINQRDGSFAEEGAQRGMGAAVDAAAFGAADFDNDGDIDIFAVPHEGPRYF